MGFRFQKRINLGAGFRLNLSKSGVGMSAGIKGLRVGIGPRGVRKTISLPGTGISYVTERRLGGSRSRSARTGDSPLGWLIGAGVVLWLMSAAWPYLLFAGGAAIATGLVWLVVRHGHARRPHSGLQPADGPSRAAPPRDEYRSLIPVDPEVFAEPVKAQTVALDVFRAWVRPVPSVPRDPTSAVRELNLRRRRVGRLVSHIVGRYPVWRNEPYGGRKPVTGPPIHADSVDPWNVDPGELRTASRHYASCDSCRGEGRVECHPCDGVGRVSCTDCRGAGKLPGLTSHGHERLLNCRSCRGRGDVKCAACTRGRTKCTVCHGKKKVDRWLEVEDRERTDIQVEPDGDVTRAFPWGKDGVDAAAEAIEADAFCAWRTERDARLSRDALTGALPAEWLDAHLDSLQPQVRPQERVAHQTFSLLEIPSIELSYTLDGEIEQTIELEGRRLLAPPIAEERLFTARAISLRRLRWILAGIPLLMLLIYAIRGPYFMGETVGAAVLCVSIACFAGYGLFWHASLNRRATRWLLPAVTAPLIGAAALAWVAEPRLSRAHELIAAGQYGAALAELDALGGAAEPAIIDARAQIALREALASSEWQDATQLSEPIPADHPASAEAVAHVDALLSRDIEAALAASSPDVALELLGRTSAAHRNTEAALDVRRRAARLFADSCLGKEDWACVFSRAGELEVLGERARANSLATEALRQIDAQARAAATAADSEKNRDRRIELREHAAVLWGLHAQHGGAVEPKALSRLEQRLARDVKARQKELERERASAERERRRQQAREARERKRAAQAERRRQRASAPLQCCDGSLSPSCTCGGPRRGCCSHHGGVCGCSP